MIIKLISRFLILFSLSISAQKYDEFHSNIFETLKPLQPTDSPVTRRYNLNLIIKELAPDGYTRPVWTANGQYPGPIIQANYGDRLLINVTNNLGEPTTIHWHGIDQKGSNLYDGTPGLVQCPIPNGYSLLYNFTVNQTGTYWYHSHIAGQLIDRLKGPMVIYDPKDPYYNKYDFEYVITISDWYHSTSDTMLSMILSHGYKGVEPMPDSGEISGKGQYNCSTAPKGSKCNPNNGIATYNIKKGKKYRFRIISISSAAHIIFSIDEHPLTIIEVDGTSIKPVTLNTIPINTAQRYSVILNANKPIKNYYIRTKLSVCTPINETTINLLNPNVLGILSYEGAKGKPTSKAYPLNKSEECRDVNPNILNPLSQLKPPQTVDYKFDLSVGFVGTPTTGDLGALNNSSFVANFNYPSNRRIINGVDPYTFPQYENAYVYGSNTTNSNDKDSAIDLYIINKDRGAHPFHLHGHSFFVVYNGGNLTANNPPNPSEFNLVDPALRDTVTVNGNSTTVIRYFVDNPGVWLFHCHIHWHLVKGMAAQMIELPSLIQNTTLPDNLLSLCVT